MFSLSATAWAADEPAAAPASPIEKVTVTARKRSEELREIPQSVTAVQGKTLDRQRDDDFGDYAGLVPGMSLETAQPGSTRIILRGINAGGVGSTVGTYLDETPYGSSAALSNGAIDTPDLDTFDIQRIEVLRGPQGTLYGASTLGGLLKFVTNAPDPSEFTSKFQAGVESVDHGGTGWVARGMVNIPLGDNAAFRASGTRRFDAGFIDDPSRGEEDVNSTDVTAFRGSLLWQATPELSVRLNGLMQNLDSDATSSEDLVLSGPVTYQLPFQTLNGDLTQVRNSDEFAKSKYRQYNATIDYDFGWAALTSVTTYATLDKNTNQDATLAFGVNLAATTTLDKFTQEARLTSPNSDRFEWLLGGYFTRESASLHQTLVSTPLFLELDSTFKEIAGFANATYHFSDMFDLEFGARYATNDQHANQFGLASAGGKSSEDVFTYSVAPRLHVDENTMLYARVAKGYRPGGPNALPPAPPPGIETFSADSLINYEVGVKSNLLDNRLALDLSAFYIDWSNVQLLTVISGFGVNGNGGSATSKGFEWTLTWVPVDHLTLMFDGAYTKAKLESLDAFTTLLTGASPGDPLPFAPEWSMMLNADYEWPIFDGAATAFVGGGVRYVGERAGGFDATFGQQTFDSYTLLDLRAGAEIGSRWTIELYGKNLTDERAILNIITNFAAGGGSLGAGGQSAVVNQPRTIGLAVTGQF